MLEQLIHKSTKVDICLRRGDSHTYLRGVVTNYDANVSMISFAEKTDDLTSGKYVIPFSSIVYIKEYDENETEFTASAVYL